MERPVDAIQPAADMCGRLRHLLAQVGPQHGIGEASSSEFAVTSDTVRQYHPLGSGVDAS